MKSEKIDGLVHKYMTAESTLDEESLLKSTLLGDTTSSEHNDLKALFAYFELSKAQTIIPDFHNPATSYPSRRRKFIRMPLIAAAASVAVIVFGYLFISQNNNTTYTDTYSDPEIAAQNATEALQLLSGELNKGGTLAIDQLKEFDNLNKYLNIFNQNN